MGSIGCRAQARPMRCTRVGASGLVLALVAIAAGCRGHERLPEQDTPAYRQVVLDFYGAVARIQSGSEQGASERLASAAEQAPAEPAIWYNAALLALRRGELTEAADLAARSRRTGPDNSDVLLLSALIDLQREDTSAAAIHLREAVHADSTNIRALFVLAREAAGRAGSDGYAEPSIILDRILRLAPNNTAAMLERMRLAAESGAWETIASLAARLDSLTVDWSPAIRDQIAMLQRDLPKADSESTLASIIRTGNLMKAVDAYRASLSQLQTDILDPSLVLTRFVRLPSPSGRPAPPDTLLRFENKPLLPPDTRWSWLSTVFQSSEGPLAAAAVGDGRIHVDPDQELHYPGQAPAGTPNGRPIAFLDFDYDFRMDLAAAGPGGLRVYRQEADGTYTNKTDQLGLPADVTGAAYSGIWSLDIDLEGDMDLIVTGRRDGPVLLRNNGDGRFTATRTFVNTRSVSDLVWADFDDDGDPDALILSDGSLHFYRNLRSGQFQFEPISTPGAVAAIHVSDFNGDGFFELLTLGSDGSVASYDLTLGSWRTAAIPVDTGGRTARPQSRSRVSTADLDNNGALDLIVSYGGRSSIWLRNTDGLILLTRFDDLFIFDEADLNADGNLGLVALDTDGRAHHLVNQSTAGYLSRSILPRAADAVGDRRINSFGIGGEIELRTDLLYQKRLITSPLIHFGLGDRQLVDVARIIWPNGTSQAQFDLATDQTLIATQSLKGSCPWVFTFDGAGMRFVTDFLWRSPLGLRINAVETAGIATTEDWVKIDGDELAPRDGLYDVRITAELWETHFFDLVELRAVDHPMGTEIFVNEVFVFPPPELKVHITGERQAITGAWDQTGRDVTAVVLHEDGRFAESFDLYTHQGLTAEHFVEVDVKGVPTDKSVWLIASGWIRPTDSSINVALGQGEHPRPQGIRLDVLENDGSWTPVHRDLGFPAGKTKTVLVDLTGVFDGRSSRRLRLATNLEIYWDAIAWAEAAPSDQAVTRNVTLTAADLRYRGFSKVRAPLRSTPETPIYDEIDGTGQRWRDLVGYHTRHGDVKELLESIDDRYVIMNAGDELALTFDAMPAPADGWIRDFVLAGDGWVKDGDYNTTFSKTVLPLPDHEESAYEQPLLNLGDNRAYTRNSTDWDRYHTRYVTPDHFARALRP